MEVGLGACGTCGMVVSQVTTPPGRRRPLAGRLTPPYFCSGYLKDKLTGWGGGYGQLREFRGGEVGKEKTDASSLQSSQRTQSQLTSILFLFVRKSEFINADFS